MEYEHSINFTIKAPKKPYWELLGYKSCEDYYKDQHFITKDCTGKYECLSCKEKQCPCLKNV